MEVTEITPGQEIPENAVRVILRSDADVPLADVPVTALRDLRGIHGRSNDAGISQWTFDEPGWFQVQIDPPQGWDLPSSISTPLLIEASREVVFTLPILGRPVALPDQREEIEPAPGLLFTVAADDLTPGLFQPLTASIAAAPVDVAEHPTDGLMYPIAAWHLDPGGMEIDRAPVRFRNLWSIPMGTELEVFQSAPSQSGPWHSVGRVAVNGPWIEGPAELRWTTTVVLAYPE